MQKYEDGDYMVLEAGDDDEDLGYAYVEDIGDLNSAVSEKQKEMYFDYESFGRDCRIEDVDDQFEEGMSDEDIGYQVVEDYYGSPSKLDKKQLEMYFLNSRY